MTLSPPTRGPLLRHGPRIAPSLREGGDIFDNMTPELINQLADKLILFVILIAWLALMYKLTFKAWDK
jgi:hypothetical protein